MTLPPQLGNPSDFRVTIAGQPDAVRQVLHDLAASPPMHNISQDLSSNATIVLAEVMNNIVEHGYATYGGNITLSVSRTAHGLDCEVSDQGAPMPGLCLPKGLAQPLDLIEDLPEGGFGWFLIRSLTEDLVYRHEQGMNRLSFRIIDAQTIV